MENEIHTKKKKVQLVQQPNRLSTINKIKTPTVIFCPVFFPSFFLVQFLTES